MASIEKLLQRLRNNPRAVRYDELVRVLRWLGWSEVGSRGSHHRFEPADGTRFLVVVKPHGGRKHVSPRAVADVLAVADQQETDR